MGFDTGGKKGAVRSDINITPLVDVVLVLLIIFMVMTPILLKQMEVKVPSKADDVATTSPPVTTEQVVLHVDKDNHITINHEPVAPEALVDKVTNIFQNRREKVMFFDIDDQANYGEVIHIMDQCRGAGAKTIGLMTKS